MQVVCCCAKHEAHKCKATFSRKTTDYSEVEQCSASIRENEQVSAVKVTVEDAVYERAFHE